MVANGIITAIFLNSPMRLLQFLINLTLIIHLHYFYVLGRRGWLKLTFGKYVDRGEVYGVALNVIVERKLLTIPIKQSNSGIALEY